MPLALMSISHDVNDIINCTLHSIGQDKHNEVLHDLFGHVMSLALALVYILLAYAPDSIFL